IDLGADYRDAAWFDRDDATARLPFSGQRWAVRHIDEIMSLGEAESSIYRIDKETPQPAQNDPGSADDIDDDDSIPVYAPSSDVTEDESLMPDETTHESVPERDEPQGESEPDTFPDRDSGA